MPLIPLTVSETVLKTLAESVIETCYNGLIVLNTEKRVLLWNQWMSRHARKTSQEVYGQLLSDVFPTLQPNSRVWQTIDMALQQGMSSVLSQSLHGSPFPLYQHRHRSPSQTTTLEEEDSYLQQMAIINPILLSEKTGEPPIHYCLIQIMDVTQAVKRENLLRLQARQVETLAQEYRNNELYLKAILDHIVDAILTVDESDIIETANPATEKIFGYTAVELRGSSLSALLIDIPVYRQLVKKKHQSLLTCEMLGKHKDGSHIPLELAVNRIQIKQRIIYVIILRDITHHKQIEEALMAEKEQALITLESIDDAVIITNAEGIVQYMNPIAEQMTSWRSNAAYGQILSNIFQVFDVSGEALCNRLYQHCLNTGKTMMLMENTVLLDANSRAYYIQGTLTPIYLREKMKAVVIAFHDVSQTRQIAHQLSYQATHDHITGLVNRFEFERRLTQTINDSHHDKRSHVVCGIRLENLPMIHNACGEIGVYELLRTVARILSSKIRDTDILARLGHAEFGVLLQGCTLERANTIANNIYRLIQTWQFNWGEKFFNLEIIIGVVSIQAETVNVSMIMSHLDMAYHLAKEQPTEGIYLYLGQEDRRNPHLPYIHIIRQAIEEKGLILHAQAIISCTQHTKNTQATPFELLLRIHHTQEKHLIYPSVFIPIAERYNLMPALDRWVIHQVFKFYPLLSKYYPHLQIHINLSAASLNEDNFLKFIHSEFEQNPIPPNVLCFEITEEIAVAQMGKVAYFAKNIRTLGCQVGLDDFGCGLLSFHHLRHLALDYIKLDGRLIEDILTDNYNLTVLQSIEKLARHLDLFLIAKRVNNPLVFHKLGEIGIHAAQGFALAEPIPLQHLLK